MLVAVLLLASAVTAAPGPSVLAIEPDSLTLSVLAKSDLAYRGGISIRRIDSAFGGFSSLRVSADGDTLLALSDRGDWMTGKLSYDGKGCLAGFALLGREALAGPGNRPFPHDSLKDSEAFHHDGRNVYVGFETVNRILRYDGNRAHPVALPLPRSVTDGVPAWGGFSSLSTTEKGDLIAITEGGSDSADNMKGFLKTGDGYRLIWLRKSWPPYLPIDLARKPDGDFLLLEVGQPKGSRGWDLARISEIAKEDVYKPGIIPARTLLEITPDLAIKGKYEGISCRGTRDGGVLLYLISDAKEAQDTRLLMFRIGPKAGGP